MDRREALQAIAAGVGDPGGEVRSRDDEVWYCVESGGNYRSVEVDVDQDSDKPFQVWLRTWDRTHGLVRESEGGTYASAAEAAHAVKEVLADIAERDARLEALLATEPTEEERYA